MINFLLGLEVINWGGWDSNGDMVMLLLTVMILLGKMILVVWFPKPAAPGTCHLGKPSRFWQLVMAMVTVMMMSRR